MRVHRRAGSWLLFAGGCLLGAWWLLHVPYHPGALYRAIPADATIVSTHRDLPNRWPAFVANPMGATLLASAGLDADPVAEAPENPFMGEAMKQLASREVVWAYLPDSGMLREPAWTFAAWIGGRSQLMRWFYTFRTPAGFQAVPLATGGACWRLESRTFGDGMSLSIAFIEGMMVGTLSRDPLSIHRVIRAHEGWADSVWDVRRRQAVPDSCAGTDAADAGWVHFGDGDKSVKWPPSIVHYAFTDMDERHLSAELCAPGVSSPLKPGLEEDETGGLDKLLMDEPMASLAFVPSALAALLESTADATWSQVLKNLLSAHERGRIWLVALDGDYSGRYRGMKVPAVVGGIEITNPEAARLGVSVVMDLLNARYRWGLVPREISSGDHPVYRLEPTTQDGAEKLIPDSLPGYALTDTHLFVATNAEALSKLLERARPGDEGAATTGRWHASQHDRPAAVCGWLDFARSAKTLRAAIKFYSLKLLVSDPLASQAERQRLNTIEAWVTALEPMEQGLFWLVSENSTSQLAIRLGSEVTKNQ